jgi:hypothetical protein
MANSIKLRQRVAATAVVYFRRLYAGSSFGAYDPHLVAPGCLYLASKVRVVCSLLICADQACWCVCCCLGGGLLVVVRSRHQKAGGGSKCAAELSTCALVSVSVQVEESVVAGKLLLASMRRLRPAWHYELKDLLDMEMVGVGWGGGG